MDPEILLLHERDEEIDLKSAMFRLLLKDREMCVVSASMCDTVCSITAPLFLLI